MGANNTTSGKKAYTFKKTEEYTLGVGGYATVYKATRKSDEKLVAIKVSKIALNENVSSKLLQEYENEMKIARSINHPFIVQSIDQFMDSKKRSCLVFEYYPEGDFESYIETRKA
jgi:serine/threonine protein kinase